MGRRVLYILFLSHPTYYELYILKRVNHTRPAAPGLTNAGAIACHDECVGLESLDLSFYDD